MPLLSNEAAALMKPWTLCASVVATALYVAALSDEFYHLTSPSWLSWHIVLRKAYSIVAFSLVGYLGRRALLEHGRTRIVVPCIVGVALYSALIEVGQALVGSREGFGWNAVDIACGAIGGFLAVIDRVRKTPARARDTRGAS